ncbi:hypothetical protein KEM63_06820 [Halopseudomonas nanhaiensis]|uniref:hypothetical protein n=1 Tax=Halopseudomonas nanhaiensis TaxID=2830842 RepID=UPI001CBEE899|nr:hypothetical protein [Halopseudomonas nanhaiensis]UAW99669.1 hypothetical protein KEM63_06820 [Halopseudomonas nanhaiensis]
MQTLKMLTAALTFASLGIAAPAMAESDSSAGSAGGQTNSTTQSTGQGSASGTTGNMGSGGGDSMNNPGMDTKDSDPEAARDTHTSPYKKTYPNEKPVGEGDDSESEENQ